MSATRNVLETLSKESGCQWNEDSMIDILCTYIENQNDFHTFYDYVKQRAKEELEARIIQDLDKGLGL